MIVIVAPGGKSPPGDPLQTPFEYLQLMPAGAEMRTPTPVPEAEIWTFAVSKSAVTFVVPVAGFSVHVPVPEQAPPQPANTEPVEGVAVRATVEPGRKPATQIPVLPGAEQNSPDGDEPTPPTPLPRVERLTSAVSKSTVTLVVPTEGVTEQVPVPGQVTPLQPLKIVLESGVAVRITVEPGCAIKVHVPPEDGPRQDRPAEDDVTMPDPAPTNPTVTRAVSNLAVTVVVPAAGLNEQVPVPGHDTPVQPVKTEFESPVAVSVTVLPGTKSDEQTPVIAGT
jgi:hypothetical protein